MNDNQGTPTAELYRWTKAAVTDSPHPRVAFWRGATAAMLTPAIGEIAFGYPMSLTGHLVATVVFALIAVWYWAKNEVVPEPEAKSAEEINA